MYFNQNKYRVNYINQKNNFNQIFTREGNVFSEQRRTLSLNRQEPLRYDGLRSFIFWQAIERK